jgi:hypothetical protein
MKLYSSSMARSRLRDAGRREGSSLWVSGNGVELDQLLNDLILAIALYTLRYAGTHMPFQDQRLQLLQGLSFLLTAFLSPEAP